MEGGGGLGRCVRACIFFHLRFDPVFYSGILQSVLDIFSGKLGPGISFAGKSSWPLHKNQMVTP